jgi:EF-hand domain pair/EF hand
MTRALFLLAAAVALGSPAYAQQQAPKPVTRAAVAGQLDGAFAAADANHDGSLSVAEIQALEDKELQQVQANLRARAQAQFKTLDTNKDGQLSLQEFSAATPSVKANETGAQLLQKLDANHDGKVSAAEFRTPRLGQFDKVDLNHDGTVTPDEERRARGQQ